MTAVYHSRITGRYFIEPLAFQGYVICDADGKQVGEPSMFRAALHRKMEELQREADRKAKRGPRPCLRCGDQFASEGIHNRMCAGCRANRAAVDTSAYRVIRPSSRG